MSARKEHGNKTAWETGETLTSPRRGVAETQMEQLKEQLLQPVLASIEDVRLIQELRWVANEAAALAWFTVCPLLVLPVLLEEKIAAALRRWERQQMLWNAAAATAENPTPLLVPPVVMAA